MDEVHAHDNYQLRAYTPILYSENFPLSFFLVLAFLTRDLSHFIMCRLPPTPLPQPFYVHLQTSEQQYINNSV